MKEITFIGKTDWRNASQAFGIKDNDRLNHIYCVGKTGTGKSTLLANMAITDIQRGNGLCIIDPHGDIAGNILNFIPENRISDVIYFNASDFDFPIGYNPLEFIGGDHKVSTVSAVISMFKKIWIESWGPRLEHILRFSLLTLVEYPGSTILDIQPLLTDFQFKTEVLKYVRDGSILKFWSNEFDRYTPQFRSEAISPILNKLSSLVGVASLRNIVGQEHTTFDMRQVINEKKILVCNLSKGLIGEDASALLGSMILTRIQSIILSRARQNFKERDPFYLYIDEMHSFVTLSISDMLSESRKYGLGVFLTNQFLDQVDEKIRNSILGNVGTLISFRIGARDGHELEKEFYPIFSTSDLLNLPQYSMYLKLMINGATSKPFSATTLPLPPFSRSFATLIIQHSRETYCKPRELVEELIQRKVAYESDEVGMPKLF